MRAEMVVVKVVEGGHRVGVVQYFSCSSGNGRVLVQNERMRDEQTLPQAQYELIHQIE